MQILWSSGGVRLCRFRAVWIFKFWIVLFKNARAIEGSHAPLNVLTGQSSTLLEKFLHGILDTDPKNRVKIYGKNVQVATKRSHVTAIFGNLIRACPTQGNRIKKYND
jgi:hypothetical protein